MAEKDDSKPKDKERFYVTGLSRNIVETIRVWKYLRGDGSMTTTIKELLLEGIRATSETRKRLVKHYAHIRGINEEQAWLEICAERTQDIDLTKLDDEAYQELFKRLEKSDIHL